MDDTLVVVLVVIGAVVAVALLATLVDLRRHDVQHFPKWVWALIIIVVSFPIGVVLYLTVGRVAAQQAGSVPRPDNTSAAIPIAPASSGGLSGRGPSPGVPVITTSAVSKVYGDTVALDGVDLVVPRGATYGLIGPNGAGKTTMLSLLAGLRHPTSGAVELHVDRRRVAVLVDTPLFEPWLTATEVVDLARHLVAPDRPVEHVEEALTEVGLAEAAGRRVGGFSRGMLQRLGLTACLVGGPEVLILDEPSSALDPSGRREVLDLIGRLAHTATVLLSTHILADVQQVCDVVGVIDRGRLRFQGPLEDLLARTASAYALHVRGPSSEFVRLLMTQPWVDTVDELAPGRLRLVTSDAGRTEHSIPRLVADHDLALVAFHPATDLETAFLELTR